jgi:hypothetical protein
MKYLQLIILLSAFLISENYPQNISPYTRYGIGDMLYTYSARSLSMGQSGSALLNDNFVSITNPGSWSVLKSTRIEFSYALNFSQLSTSSDSRTYRQGDFKGFTFAFPVSKDYGIGVAMGLIPYSRLHYSVQQIIANDPIISSKYIENLKGEGGLSRIFIGSSYKLPFDLILGASFDYYFGNLEYNSQIIFPDNSQKPSEYNLIYSPTGVGTTLGIISPDMSGLLNDEVISNLRLGISMNLIPEMNTDSLLTTKSNTFVDTVAEGTTTMKIPSRFTFGAAVTLSDEYVISADYSLQAWSDFKFTPINEQNLKNAQRISAGFEFRPKPRLGMTFWEQIMWRFGLSYEQTQYVIKNNNLQEYSVSGGFSLPVGPENSIDLGFEYASRGTKNDNLISENFFRFNLGFSFGDIWFSRYEK